MPIYEYFCEACQKTAEILQKFDEAPPRECPECGARDSLKKAVTTSAFHLKGGGWYKDLYSSSKSKPETSEKPKKKEE